MRKNIVVVVFNRCFSTKYDLANSNQENGKVVFRF